MQSGEQVTCLYTRLKVQLRPITTQKPVNVTVVLHTFCIPEIWDCFSDADADSSLVRYDSVYID